MQLKLHGPEERTVASSLEGDGDDRTEYTAGPGGIYHIDVASTGTDSGADEMQVDVA